MRKCDPATCETLHPCSKCQKPQACGEYYRRKSRPPGGRDRRGESMDTCRTCHNGERVARKRNDTPEQRKDAMLRWKFGITLAEFQARLAHQGGRCAICETDTPRGRGTWSVDHDHSCCPGAKSCGKCIRGLLCTNCNTALGLLQDNATVMRRAARYVEM